MNGLKRDWVRAGLSTLVLTLVQASALADAAPKSEGPRDTLIFENGDTLQGKREREVSGTVYFLSDELGEVMVPWAKIRSLQTQSRFVVLENKPGVRHTVVDAARGALQVEKGALHVTPGTPPATEAGGHLAVRGERIEPGRQPIPVANAQFILDDRTFDRQVRLEPNIFAGWNGTATAGVTLVQGTENQRTYTSAVALVRAVPTVSWLATRNRTTLNFSSSYGLITQPAYTANGVAVPESSSLTSIFHADAERDQYFANRAYVLAQTAFDHNYSQGLDLQQIFGAGIGYTVIKQAAQELDLKATLQYEKQVFFSGSSGTNQNLIGSTFASNYRLKLKSGITFTQQLAFIPAFNNSRAYSANETNTFTFPLYKNLAFTLGTIDSYLNDPAPAVPPILPNSFQFTTGITYSIKSKY